MHMSTAVGSCWYYYYYYYYYGRTTTTTVLYLYIRYLLVRLYITGI